MSRSNQLRDYKRVSTSFGLVFVGLFAAAAATCAHLPQSIVYALSAVATTSSYLLFLYALVTELRPSRDQIAKNFLLAVILYLAYTMLLIAQFGGAWNLAGGFGTTSPDFTFAPSVASFTDSVYFSTTIFTTVGFGDFAPKSDPAKWYFSFEGLVSITHNVAFFSILLTHVTTAFSTESVRADRHE